MAARHRATIGLLIFCIVCFAIHVPLDNSVCDPKVWGKYRPASQDSAGDNFFTKVFRGGGGTPAVFAMLGGQRYLVANILWNYSDVLFHKGKPYEMVPALDAAVTLNPSFTEAWSVYGWHVAWNLQSYEGDDIVLKAKRIEQGETIYRNAVIANPDKPRPYFDMAWLYITREGNYQAALPYLRQVIEDRQHFKPMTPEEKKQTFNADPELIRERKWDPKIFGNRLAYVYKKLAIVTGKQDYFAKAIQAYKESYQLDPTDKAGLTNAATLEKNRYSAAWLKKEQADEAQHRQSFGMAPVDFAESAKQGVQTVYTFEGSAPSPVIPPPSSAEYYGSSQRR